MYTLNPQAYGNLASLRRLVGGNWTRRYYHFNALGTTDRITDDTQTVTDRYQLDPWGKVLATTGTTVNPFRFVGELGYYRYATSIVTEASYVRARHYDPNFARWWSQDPLGILGPDGANLYWYVRNRPTWAVDASGFGVLDSILDFLQSILPFLPCAPTISGIFSDYPKGTNSADYAGCIVNAEDCCGDPSARAKTETDCRNCIISKEIEYLVAVAAPGIVPLLGDVTGVVITNALELAGKELLKKLLSNVFIVCTITDTIATIIPLFLIHQNASAEMNNRCTCPQSLASQ